MMQRRSLLVLGAGLAVLPRFTLAAEAADAFIRRFSGDAVRVLRETANNPTQRRAQLGAFLERGFDLPTIGRIVLGRYWRTASAAQQAEYQRLFQAFVVDSYGRRLDQYRDQTVRVVGSRPAGEDVSVESYVEGGASGPARLDWRVRQSGDGWRIVDLVVEGVSMAITQRNEFAALIDRNGGNLEPLLADLRKRTVPPG